MLLNEVEQTDLKKAGVIVQQMYHMKHKMMSWPSDTKPTIRGLVEELDDPFLMSLTKDMDFFIEYGQKWLDLNPNDIFSNRTELPGIDDILDDPEYFKDKKSTAFKIVQMRPTMYGIHSKHGFGQAAGNFTPEQDLINKYALKVLDGSKMPLPYLRYTLTESRMHGKYVAFGQEGRHRAIVAQTLGAETMPCMVIAEVYPPTQDVETFNKFQHKIWSDFND